MTVTNIEQAGNSDMPTEEPGAGRLDSAGAGHRRVRLLSAVVVGLVGVAASFKLRTVPVPTDPWHYVLAGSTFPSETWNLVGLTRYGMVLPMIPITHLFHESELSFYLTPCLATGLLIGTVYWLTTRFFGGIAGLAAAVLTLANGVILVSSTRMYPDVYAVAVTALAVATVVAARDQWARDQRVGPRGVLLLVLTGILVGLSWWMRETAVLAWPIIGALLFWKGGPQWRLSLPAVAVPAVGMLGLEMLISQWAFGDPMARFKVLTGSDLSATTNPADMPYLGQGRLTYLLTMPRGFLTVVDGHWMLAMGAIALMSGLLFPRKVGLFAGWFALVFLLFAAVGGGLRPDHPNIRLDVARYWVAYLPAMIIAAVGGMATLLRFVADRWLGDRRASSRLAVAGAVALVLVAGPVATAAEGVREGATYVTTNHNATGQFRNWLHANDRSVTRVFTDWESARILPTYTRSFTGRKMSHVTWHSLTGERLRKGDYVVLFSAYNQACFFCNTIVNSTWLPEHREQLQRWKKVWQTDDRTFVVYKVTPRR